MEAQTPYFRRGVAGLIPDAWIVPGPDAGSAPPVVAVHGITRNCDDLLSCLQPRAQTVGRTLVIPHFDLKHWRRYQRAACPQRADLALLGLMRELRAEGRVRGGAFDLSGFSGGAQFAHRFTWLYPGAVARLCVTSAGWWTFPNRAVAWPYGIGAAPNDGGRGFQLQANLRRLLDREIVVCVGSDDLERDRNLRKGRRIDAQQGRTRVARAHRWCEAAQDTARHLGLTPRITFRSLDGCRHSFVECVRRGALDVDFVRPAPASTHTKTETFRERDAA